MKLGERLKAESGGRLARRRGKRGGRRNGEGEVVGQEEEVRFGSDEGLRRYREVVEFARRRADVVTRPWPRNGVSPRRFGVPKAPRWAREGLRRGCAVLACPSACSAPSEFIRGAGVWEEGSRPVLTCTLSAPQRSRPVRTSAAIPHAAASAGLEDEDEKEEEDEKQKISATP